MRMLRPEFSVDYNHKMRNFWDPEAAALCTDELDLRAYSSRLLGSDPELVLLGGGNTSIKLPGTDGEEWLYVKGTGADLACVTANDFTPLRLQPLRNMLRGPDLDYSAMMQELSRHIVTRDAPRPSIETLLHAALPARYVEHTHADSILALTNTTSGMALAERVFAGLAIVVPYRHSGFALAKICADAWADRATPATIGIVLMHHGAVACGATARESYENMLRLVGCAENYLASRGVMPAPEEVPAPPDDDAARAIADLRRDISRVAGYPLLLNQSDDAVATAFARNPDLDYLATQSPATPQHAVFARRVPLTGRDAAAFGRRYAAYLDKEPGAARVLDAAPRIVLDRQLGMLAAGITAWHMDAARVSYRHSMATMLEANAHDRYEGLPPRAVLAAELEYGGFEHRMTSSDAAEFSLVGSVAWVSSSLGELMHPVVSEFLARGSAVVCLAVDSALGTTDPSRLDPAFNAGNPALLVIEANDPRPQVTAVRRFGGVDTLVCTADDRRLLTRTLPWLALSPVSPRVVLPVSNARSDGTDADGIPAELAAKRIALIRVQVGALQSVEQAAFAIADAATPSPRAIASRVG